MSDSTTSSDAETARVAVVGNGLMGHGIAEVFASSGHEVVLIGRNRGSLDLALQRIRSSAEEFVEHGLLPEDDVDPILARISTSTRLEDAEGAALVIEALSDDIELKRETLRMLDGICPPSAILASTSGRPTSSLVGGVAHRDRVIATHFWYPPQLLPLVEVCAGPETSPETTLRTCELLRGAGRDPVVIDKEIDGFIGNRIQFAALREAWSLWASGVASASTIDAVMRNGIGRRYAVTGPIESADLAGLPTMAGFASFLQPSLSNDAQPPPRVVELAETAGATVRGRSPEEQAQLLAARRRELIRWLKADRGLG